MTNFGTFFINFTWILLPVMIYLIYEVYAENVSKNKDDLVLSFCLFSSFYLMLRFGLFKNDCVFSVFFDFIILLFYIKKRCLNSLFVSVLVILYLYAISSNVLYIIICKFIVFYFLSFFKVSQFLLFTFLCNFIFILFLGFIVPFDLFSYFVYYFVMYFIILFFLKAEKIIEINVSYKELLKEKELRQSLFKISHEIKNPIAVCKGYLDMFDVNNMNHFSKYIPIIKSEINKTLNLLQDFCACNKINLNCDIIDICLLFEDIMNNFKLLFDSKDVCLNVSIPDDEVFVYGDYNRLNQVFLNIIKNSIEAIDIHKKSFINVYTRMDEKNIRIYIEDNGIGISSENLKRISEPFYTTKQNGTGLGVLLANEIVSAHNGSIEYNSKEGVGTTVIITLPLYIF